METGRSGRSATRLAHRLFCHGAAAMLGRNTIVSCATFLVGVAILWASVDKGGMAKVPATSLSFVIATTLHYGLGRAWIFRGTERGIGRGYIYFLGNAVAGLIVTTVLFATLIDHSAMNYLIARAIVSVVAGLIMFLSNAMLNFRRL